MMKRSIPALVLFLAIAGTVRALEIPKDGIPIVSFNGAFKSCPETGRCVSSANGGYTADYDVEAVSDELRLLENYRFYERERLLYTLHDVPGSDMMVSNSGITAFMDHSRNFQSVLTIHFVNRTGKPLFSRTVHAACLFGFSPEGNRFGIGDRDGFHVLDPETRREILLPHADRFDFSQDGKRLALARNGVVRIFEEDRLLQLLETGLELPRGIRLSGDSLVAVIDKHHLRVFDLEDGKLVLSETLTEDFSFRDLAAVQGGWAAGIHEKTRTLSRGLVRVYFKDGIIQRQGESRTLKPAVAAAKAADRSTDYPVIPWMFQPFDQMPEIWNYYEQAMNAGYYNYLHQGLDIVVPMEEPVYTVAPGYVKCKLTIGGAKYWRLATSASNTGEETNGWLYAHLVEGSIQVEVGDRVDVHEYLGDIVQWYRNWGHVHFAEIQDHGMPWRFDDDEWGITYNPLLSLRPNTDANPPRFLDVLPGSKFLFCGNNGGGYLRADSLYGAVDIVVHAVDTIGASPWQQPAYESHYWIVNLPERDVRLDRTLGHRLNHAYDFYNSDHFSPYAAILYKEDAILQPSSWMDSTRAYYHIITHEDEADNRMAVTDSLRALNTLNFPDGNYRIFVEIADQFGNTSTDSTDVKIRNHSTGILDTGDESRICFLGQNNPNPFNAETRFSYRLSMPGIVDIRLFDAIGREVAVLASGMREQGSHVQHFHAENLPAGLYFCRMRSREGVLLRKWILLR